ncbi:MAG: TolC family protein [Thioalkalivibrio sp.]|nr:TolC family protein [Thioalkalivibrio sp.]
MKRFVVLIMLIACRVSSAPIEASDTPRVLMLQEAVEIALQGNPEVAEARTRLAEAEARLDATRAFGQPWLKLRGAYDFWTMEQRLFPATRNGEPGVFGPGVVGAEVVLSMPLYTGGRQSAEVEAADWMRKAASAQVERVRESLVFQVTSIFHGLLAQDAVLRSLDTAVAAMDEQLRVTRTLVDAGKAAKVDLLRAEVRRAELHERRLREQSIRIVQQRAWAVLLGLDDAAAPEPEGTLELDESPLCPDAETCMQRALRQRSDHRAGQDAVAALEASVSAARSGSRPILSAQASYGGRWMTGSVDAPDEADQQGDLGRIGLVVEVPLFNGNLTSSRVAEQNARLRGGQERLRRLVLQIRYEIEIARAQIRIAWERVQTSGQAVGQAEESFRVVKEKYDLGKGTLTDVLDAQSALVTAEGNYARALADVAVADAQRRLATGEILP